MRCRNNIATGFKGEELSVTYLENNGYHIVERNFRSRGGEVDIIARDRDGTLVFVEVKARKTVAFGLPQSAVNSRKQRQISKGALAWLLQQGLTDCAARFDVIAVLLHDGTTHELDHIINAFELSY